MGTTTARGVRKRGGVRTDNIGRVTCKNGKFKVLDDLENNYTSQSEDGADVNKPQTTKLG